MAELPALYHYAAEPLTAMRDAAQDTEPGMKPRGLWLSAETGNEDDWSWRDWCEAAEFRLDRLACRTPVLLVPDARVLHLPTEDAVRAFDAEFASPIVAGTEELFPTLAARWVDWRKVAERYRGIVIAPYREQLRLEFNLLWYYSWDCACGCIWDASAVRQIGPAERREACSSRP